MSQHSSQGGMGSHDAIESEFTLRVKLASIHNRDKFLLDCLEEKVLPKSAPVHLQHLHKPFSNTAREYLEEARETLRHEAEEIKDKIRNLQLPQDIIELIRKKDQQQKEKLQKKLEHLCNCSKWKEIGRQDLIRNLSSYDLTQTQKEALALGLKFSTNISNKKLVDYVGRNYNWKDSEMDNGFKQGVLLCCAVSAKCNSVAIPRRYVRALSELRDNSDIIVTTADKGGGVVIMNTSDYVNKMEELLDDTNTYCKQRDGQAQEEAMKFNKNVRKVLKKSEKGKKLLYLLEEDPKIPKMKGLPKIHKPGIPLRPITSGIGSAPHRLAKYLAKPLSSALGKISGAHLKNSTDLISRLGVIDFTDMCLVSFDVKSLFTNVPLDGAISAVKKVLEQIDASDLPVSKTDYVKLVEMCMRFGPFCFNNQEYRQHEGLPMGSPLSAVTASLFMEVLEKEHFSKIVTNDSKWYRYVDDCLVITHKDTDMDDLLRKLNNVHNKIQFTVENESDGQLPFLDAVIMRTDIGVKFKVYRKPTNKDDFIHYFSAHDEKTKSGVVIGFFLRALRICSEEYVKEEIKYIMDTFVKLGYPRGMVLALLKKAEKIRQRRVTEEESSAQYIVVPNSQLANMLRKVLRPMGVVVINDTGKKIGELVKHKKRMRDNDNSVVYKIPCGGCDSAYYGESYRGLDKRIREHRADVKYHRVTNALVNHVDEKGHLPNWEHAEVLEKGLTRQQRKVIEALYISTNNSTNQRTGDVKWTRVAAAFAATERRPGRTNESAATRRIRRDPG